METKRKKCYKVYFQKDGDKNNYDNNEGVSKTINWKLNESYFVQFLLSQTQNKLNMHIVELNMHNKHNNRMMVLHTVYSSICHSSHCLLER